MGHKSNKLHPKLIWHALMVRRKAPARTQLVSLVQPKGDIRVANVDCQ